jgi:hypothetical protein
MEGVSLDLMLMNCSVCSAHTHYSIYTDFGSTVINCVKR